MNPQERVAALIAQCTAVHKIAKEGVDRLQASRDQTVHYRVEAAMARFPAAKEPFTRVTNDECSLQHWLEKRPVDLKFVFDTATVAKTFSVHGWDDVGPMLDEMLQFARAVEEESKPEKAVGILEKLQAYFSDVVGALAHPLGLLDQDEVNAEPSAELLQCLADAQELGERFSKIPDNHFATVFVAPATRSGIWICTEGGFETRVYAYSNRPYIFTHQHRCINIASEGDTYVLTFNTDANFKATMPAVGTNISIDTMGDILFLAAHTSFAPIEVADAKEDHAGPFIRRRLYMVFSSTSSFLSY